MPQVQQNLNSISPFTTPSAYAPSPLIFTIKNNLNSSITSLAIAADSAWQFDNSAVCGQFLKLTLQSSSAIQCAGDLPVHVTDVLQLGHISHKTITNKTSLNSEVTIVPQLAGPYGNVPGPLVTVPFTVPRTAVTFALNGTAASDKITSLSAAIPANDAAAQVSLSAPSTVDASSQVSGTYPAANNYYFAFMSNTSEIYWESAQWINYPNMYRIWNTNGDPCNQNGACGTYQWINQSDGYNLQTDALGGSGIAGGIQDLSGFNTDPSGSSFTNGVTISVAEIASKCVGTPNYAYTGCNAPAIWWGQSPSGQPPSVSSNGQWNGSSYYEPYLYAGINNGFPNVSINSTTVYNDTTTSYFAAWSLRLSCSSESICSLQVYLDTGTGFVNVYNDNTDDGLAWFAKTGGFLYYGQEQTCASGFYCTPTNPTAIPYISLWAPNNPVAEGTFDMNMWYLSRHYVTFPSVSGYTNDAAIVDSDPTPIWITYDGQTLFSGMTNGASRDTQSLQIVTQNETQWTMDFSATGIQSRSLAS